MSNSFKQSLQAIVRFGTAFSAAGFFLQFIWESIQCSPFFRHVGAQPTWGSMVLATAGDILMMWLVYFIVSVFKKSFLWFQKDWNIQTLMIIILTSVALATLVEFWGLQTARWTYTAANPIVPLLGISLLPLLQMLFINPIAMYCSKKFLSRKYS